MSNVASGNILESVAIVGVIDPDAYATGATNTTVVDMKYFREVLFIVMVGDLGSSATVDFEVDGDTASDGSFTTKITGKSITQLTDAGTDSNKQVEVRVTAQEAATQGFRYLRGKMTVGTATSDSGAIVLAYPLRYAPAAGFDLSTVDEQITS